jgi:hypothetical protein
VDLLAGPRRGSRAASIEDEQAAIISVTDRRLASLRAALGFLHLAPRAPELRLLHRWLDTWTGLGLMVVGVERPGLRFSLSYIAEGEWRAQFSAHPMWASAGYGVGAPPWQAVQRAAWAGAIEERDLVAVSPPLELPGRIAPDVEVVLVQAGVVAITGELDLNPHLGGARHRQLTDCAHDANS